MVAVVTFVAAFVLLSRDHADRPRLYGDESWREGVNYSTTVPVTQCSDAAVTHPVASPYAALTDEDIGNATERIGAEGRRLVLYGDDDRKTVPCDRIHEAPWSFVAQVHMVVQGRVISVASGYVFAPNMIMTSAHAVYRAPTHPIAPGFAHDVVVTIGTCDGQLATPHDVTAVYVPRAYQESVQRDVEHGRYEDWAILYVPTLRAADPIRSSAAGTHAYADGRFGAPGYIAGYPGNSLKFFYQRGSLQTLRTWFPRRFVTSDIDVTAGNSGGPCVARGADGSWTVEGIVRGSDDFAGGRWNNCVSFTDAMLQCALSVCDEMVARAAG